MSHCILVDKDDFFCILFESSGIMVDKNKMCVMFCAIFYVTMFTMHQCNSGLFNCCGLELKHIIDPQRNSVSSCTKMTNYQTVRREVHDKGMNMCWTK